MDISFYFKQAIEKKASDLHLVEGSIPSLRISGELVQVGEKAIPKGELKYAIFSLIDKVTKLRFEEEKELDLAMDFYKNTFRVNLHLQSGHIGLTARRIPTIIPSPEQIDLNETIKNVSNLRDGLVLITGPSGAGKSTTLAVLIDLINKNRRAHILTIEDPIEYNFKDELSIIEQRELGRDTKSFEAALKSALRQDPNVIMVGEMRDRETVDAAITAAKTGHLVLSTLHTSSAAETIERVMDFFPTQYRNEVANQLANSLRVVVSQQLISGIGGELVAAREILINNDAVSNLIRSSKIEQIQNTIQTNAGMGMMTMNKSIDNLLESGKITEETARRRKRNLDTGASYY